MRSGKTIEGAAFAAEKFDENELEAYAAKQSKAISDAAAETDLACALASIAAWWRQMNPALPPPPALFERVLASWRSRPDGERASATLAALVERFYWDCFQSNVGSKCHSFVEFNGVMSKFVELVRLAEVAGIEPRTINQHHPNNLQVDNHHLEYLGEKLRCIFAPFIRDNPEAEEILRRSIFG